MSNQYLDGEEHFDKIADRSKGYALSRHEIIIFSK